MIAHPIENEKHGRIASKGATCTTQMTPSESVEILLNVGKLTFIQLLVEAALGKQFLMIALLNHVAVPHH